MDPTENYLEDLSEKELSPELQGKTMRRTFFKEPRTDKEVMMAASKNSKFVRFTDAETEEFNKETASRIEAEIGRKVVNATSYILSILPEVEQEEAQAQLTKGLGIPPKPEVDPAGTTMGTIIDFGAAFAGGKGGLALFNKFYNTVRTSRLAAGSAPLMQQAAAVVAGEALATNMVSPETNSAYVEIAQLTELDETFAKPIVDLGMYAFSHDMDDGKIEKFLKTFTGDLILAKNLEQVFRGVSHVAKQFKEFSEVQKRLSKIAPHIKGLVDQGDISDEIKAKELLAALSIKLPEGPVGDEVLENITEELIRKSKEGNLVQLAAGKEFVKDTAFVNPDGSPMMFSHVGNLKGKPTTYAQGVVDVGDGVQGHSSALGMHFTNLKEPFHEKASGAIPSSFEREGQQNLFWVAVDEEEVLRLDDFFNDVIEEDWALGLPHPDEAVNNIRDFVDMVSLNDRFDMNEIQFILRQGEDLTDQQLTEIIVGEGLDPAGYSLDAVRDNWVFERILDSGGYRAITYDNAVQGGQSLVLIDPDKQISSIHSMNVRKGRSLAIATGEVGAGVRVLTAGESQLAEDLIQATKQQEQEFGLEFTPGQAQPGIDFNFKNFNTSEDVQTVIDDISVSYSDMIKDATRGKITHDMTRQLAEELDWDINDVIARQRGGTFNAEEMLASRHMLLASANKLDKLAGKINLKKATDEDRLAFAEQIKMHSVLQAQIKGAQTEAGRLLSSFRIKADVDFKASERLLDYENVDEMAENYSKLKTNKEKNKYSQLLNQQKWKTYLFAYSNSLLSNPKTQIVNFFGNAGFQLYKVPESLVEQTIASGRRLVTGGTTGARYTDSMAALTAMPQAFKHGFVMAGKAFRTGRASDEFTKFEYAINNHFSSTTFDVDASSLWGRGIDLLGYTVGLPGRSLLTQDEFFKGFTFEMQKQISTNQKLLSGISEGLDDIDLTNSYYNGKNGYDSEVNEIAANQAHTMTFTKDLDGFLKEVQLMRHKFPAIQVMIPFFRAPVNILGSAVSRTPLAGLSPSIRQDIMAGGPRADKAMAKIGLGTSVAWMAYNEAIEGRITGGGSGQRALDKHMKSVGREPYSMVFKKNEMSEETLAELMELGVDAKVVDDEIFIPYRKFEPLSTIMAMSADLADFNKFYHAEHTDDTLSLPAAASAFAIQNLSNTTFLNNIYDFVRATQDPDTFLINWLGDLAASNIPAAGLVGGIEQIQDPAVREPDIPRNPSPTEKAFYKMLARVQQRIPGYSDELPLGLNVWGEERKYTDGHWTTLFNPAHTVTGKRQPIDFEIERLGNVLQMPSNEVEGIVLSNRDFNKLVKVMNNIEVTDDATGITGNFREALNQLVQLDDYKLLARDEQIALLDNIKNKFVKTARTILISEDDTLYEDILELKQLEADQKLDAREGIVQ